jgi:two-component system, NarL family, response regulator DegU
VNLHPCDATFNYPSFWEPPKVYTELSSIKVAIVDPQSLVREALAALLNAADGISVVASIGSAPDVVPTLQNADVDVMVFRFDPSAAGSTALLQEVPRVTEFSRVIVLTTANDADIYAKTVELGALGVLSCDDAGSSLLKAIRKVNAGELWLDRSRTAGVLTRLTRGALQKDPETRKIESLTPRQREIVMLVSEGLTNKQVSDRLFISEATARNHITSILDKLELRDRFQLAVYAFRHGLVTYPRAVEFSASRRSLS